MKKFLVIAALLVPSVSFAQQIDQNEFMQRAVATLQNQRNSALDAQAAAEARLAILADQLNKANARIKELEDKAKESEKKDVSPPPQKE